MAPLGLPLPPRAGSQFKVSLDRSIIRKDRLEVVPKLWHTDLVMKLIM